MPGNVVNQFRVSFGGGVDINHLFPLIRAPGHFWQAHAMDLSGRLVFDAPSIGPLDRGAKIEGTRANDSFGATAFPVS